MFTTYCMTVIISTNDDIGLSVQLNHLLAVCCTYSLK